MAHHTFSGKVGNPPTSSLFYFRWTPFPGIWTVRELGSSCILVMPCPLQRDGAKGATVVEQGVDSLKSVLNPAVSHLSDFSKPEIGIQKAQRR